jgi:hypothetical protein
VVGTVWLCRCLGKGARFWPERCSVHPSHHAQGPHRQCVHVSHQDPELRFNISSTERPCSPSSHPSPRGAGRQATPDPQTRPTEQPRQFRHVVEWYATQVTHSIGTQNEQPWRQSPTH